MRNLDGPSVRRFAVAALAVVVVLSAAVGPVAAASGSVEVQAALDNDADSTTMQFSFTASQDGTVTLGGDDTVRRDGGNVEFSFQRWSGGGSSGSSSSWTVSAGTTYTVTYNGAAISGASEGQYSPTVTVDYQSGSRATSETLYLDVQVLEPAFGSVGTVSGKAVFEQGSNAETTVTADVPNDGDGVMVVDDVSFSGVPSGMSASLSSSPNRIQAGRSGSFDIHVTADSSVSEGTHSFQATVTDNLGNSRTFTVDVEVVKAPVAQLDDGTVDLGDVLVGDSKTIDVPVNELGGYEGLDGLDLTLADGDPAGSVGADVPYGFSTSPGGSATISMTVAADSDARQHEQLEFQVDVSGTDSDSPTRTATLTGRVVYPAKLGRVTGDPGTLVFDEPRDQVSAQRQEATVEFTNEGDLEMEVTSVEASVDDSRISTGVSDVPSTVAGQETGRATVTLAADPDTPEGIYDLSLTVRTADAGTKTIQRQFRLEHEHDLAVERPDVQFGEVTITEQVSRSISVGERLGYEDLDGVSVSVVDGPDRWLSITSKPSSHIDAGSDAPLVLALRFDTNAEAYQQYTWDIRVDADNAEAETISVSATAQLLSVEGITSDLQDRAGAGQWQGRVADRTTSALNSLEQSLRDGESVSSGDIWRSLTIGQSSVILIDSVGAAREQQASGNFEQAQPRVVSALVARNLVGEYVSELDDDQVASTLQTVVGASDRPVSEVVAEQKSHYRSVLSASDSTALERYSASESLATLNRYQGNDEEASTYAERSQEAFSTYSTLVEEGTQHRQRARDAVADFESSATLTVLGQPVVLNPARIDQVGSVRQTVSSNYDTAAERFRNAGAPAEASATVDEAAAANSKLSLAAYALYGLTALYGVVFAALVVREVLNARTYVREAEEAASGDFLL